jgi:hypothetical protein
MSNLTQRQKITILSVIAVFLGIGGGYLFFRGSNQSAASSTTADGTVVETVTATVASSPDAVKKGDVFGSPDASSFKDSAQGYLAAGATDGEGSHVLLRAGGKSQTVDLTSSVTDLDMFIGMNVKIWGETFKGQKAGWLMDVGRIEVLDTEGEAPTN